MTTDSKISDSDIQQAVLEELRWDTNLREARIGVSVIDKVVTLTGNVDTLEERVAAHEAAHRVKGVLDVANDVRVGPSTRVGRTDSEIAQAVRQALECCLVQQAAHIRTTITHGWVLLEGDVASSEERDDAESGVKNVIGVCGVNNELRVVPPAASPNEIKRAIEAALARRASREAKRVDLDVVGDVVVLTGFVNSLPDREAVVGAARSTLGVREVDDRLQVQSQAL